jgi:hypothetical protein
MDGPPEDQVRQAATAGGCLGLIGWEVIASIAAVALGAMLWKLFA